MSGMSVNLSVCISACFSVLRGVIATNQLHWGDASDQLYGQRVSVL